MSDDRRIIKEVHLPVLYALDDLMQKFPHTAEKRDYGRKRIFENGMRCDLLCHQEKKPAVLRFNRGAWLVKQYPTLGLLFDETLAVVSKLNISTVEEIEQKHLV